MNRSAEPRAPRHAEDEPYAVIVWKGTGQPKRLPFAEPEDALVAGIGYLRRGYQVRLADRTCAALGDPSAGAYARIAGAVRGVTLAGGQGRV